MGRQGLLGKARRRRGAASFLGRRLDLYSGDFARMRLVCAFCILGKGCSSHSGAVEGCGKATAEFRAYSIGNCTIVLAWRYYI